MSVSGFVQLRRGIIEHLTSGRMDSDEFAAYSLIILLADHKTGIWNGSAKALRTYLHWQHGKTKFVLRSLISNGYISRNHIPGRIGNYQISVSKYFPSGQEEAPHQVNRNTLAPQPQVKKKHPEHHSSGQEEGPLSISTTNLQENTFNKARKRADVFSLPDWVPNDAWNGYCEMRFKIRKPMTTRAKKMAVSKLEALMQQGHTPTAVLEQSIFNSWQGLFPIRGDLNGNGTGKHSSRTQNNLSALRRALESGPQVGYPLRPALPPRSQ